MKKIRSYKHCDNISVLATFHKSNLLFSLNIVHIKPALIPFTACYLFTMKYIHKMCKIGKEKIRCKIIILRVHYPCPSICCIIIILIHSIFLSKAFIHSRYICTLCPWRIALIAFRSMLDSSFDDSCNKEG